MQRYHDHDIYTIFLRIVEDYDWRNACMQSGKA
jgi:hypothetical protein